MHFSNGERVNMMLLAEIHSAQNIKDGLDADLIASALASGQEWAIGYNYSDLLGLSYDIPGVPNEVFNILDMWSFIESAVSDLSPADLDVLKTKVGHGLLAFSGFDGNNDAHFGTAKFAIEKMGLFDEFAGRDLNSHSRTSLPRYREMYRKFESIRPQLANRSLTLDDLAELLSS